MWPRFASRSSFHSASTDTSQWVVRAWLLAQSGATTRPLNSSFPCQRASMAVSSVANLRRYSYGSRPFCAASGDNRKNNDDLIWRVWRPMPSWLSWRVCVVLLTGPKWIEGTVLSLRGWSNLKFRSFRAGQVQILRNAFVLVQCLVLIWGCFITLLVFISM